MDHDVNGGTPQPIVIREKAKRGARACIQCRKLKKTCEGGSAPCVRCKASGAQCVFDKPASSVVEDAGLSRLASIEAALATNERRMDTVVQQMGEISNVLTEVMLRLKAPGGGSGGHPMAPSPASLPYPPAQVSPYTNGGGGPFDSAASASSQPTPPAFTSFARSGVGSGNATYSPGFQPLPSLPNFPTPPSSSALPNPPSSFHPIASTSAALPSSSSSSAVPKPPDYPSGLDALASLASSNSPDIHRFASRMGQPISALADAVAQLNGGREDHEGAGGEGGSGSETDQKPDLRELGGGNGTGGRKGEDGREEGEEGGRAGADGEPPAKRSKLGGTSSSNAQANPSSPDQFDLVAKGLMSDQDARALVLLWMKECQPFCSVLDPSADTYESLRRRSPFLFNVVVYTALRAQERNAPPSKELLAAAEETRRFAQNQVFRTPTLEDVQAVFIMACYHQEPYILSGMGLRLALSGRFETTWDQIEAHGIAKTDEKARRLTAQLRTWTYVLQLEYKHSRYSGRKIIVLREDLDKAISQADRLLTLPFAISSDVRHVANLRLVGIERQIMCETASMSPSEPNIAHQAAYVHEKAAKLLEWHSHYDAIIAGFEPSPLAWPRKSHTRMWHDANLFLVANAFKQQLLDRPSTASPELNQIAQGALSHARANLLTVLGSPVYREGARWSGYLLRVDLSFAAIFLLKSAAAYPQLVDRDDVAKDVGQLADLLSGIAGSQRYSATLRVARDQYLARSGAPTTPSDSTASIAATVAAAAASISAGGPNPSSLRNILVPQLPTLSAPLSTSNAFGTTGQLPAFASAASTSSMPDASASLAPAAYPASATTPSATQNMLSSAGADASPLPAVNSGKALLPGELDFDFSLAAMPQALFDDPGVLLRQDWTAVGDMPVNWPEWT
ncbi:hypothetical protein JCM6882_006169 [Rhodosporidiobolus microsporus]